jgi:hypothetical protein
MCRLTAQSHSLPNMQPALSGSQAFHALSMPDHNQTTSSAEETPPLSFSLRGGVGGATQCQHLTESMSVVRVLA